ncbi:MAG TPA: type III pantothenate kinase [Methylophilaceae bacterium]|nr:type III pantothenate kinase [Methylophilaceae bacterium]
MILAIDAGNSRTKWGVFSASGELRSQGAIPNYELSSMAAPEAWQGCRRAVISNVAGEQAGMAIANLLQQCDISQYWVKSSALGCGVTNGYQFPERLGGDRWAALIAAWQQHHAPCVVVNAGTALTVDALGAGEDGQGVFLGGLIVPGLRLMQQSLVASAAGINEAGGSVEYFPSNTENAIYTGALSAMAGAVNSMLVKLELHAGQAPYCIVSGGDAVLLQEMLVHYRVEKIVMADNLVLQGLLLLEKEMGKGA